MHYRTKRFAIHAGWDHTFESKRSLSIAWGKRMPRTNKYYHPFDCVLRFQFDKRPFVSFTTRKRREQEFAR